VVSSDMDSAASGAEDEDGGARGSSAAAAGSKESGKKAGMDLVPEETDGKDDGDDFDAVEDEKEVEDKAADEAELDEDGKLSNLSARVAFTTAATTATSGGKQSQQRTLTVWRVLLQPEKQRFPLNATEAVDMVSPRTCSDSFVSSCTQPECDVVVSPICGNSCNRLRLCDACDASRCSFRWAVASRARSLTAPACSSTPLFSAIPSDESKVRLALAQLDALLTLRVLFLSPLLCYLARHQSCRYPLLRFVSLSVRLHAVCRREPVYARQPGFWQPPAEHRRADS
jgi:hypothetical protein